MKTLKILSALFKGLAPANIKYPDPRYSAKKSAKSVINPEAIMKNQQSLFPDITRQQKWDRINAAWDLTRAFPVPKFQLICPVCKGEEILYKRAKYHRRGSVSPKDPYRCDATFKCCTCSNVWNHGIVVPQEMIDRHKFKINRNYHYTQIREYLEKDEKAENQ